jgi:hypothetical protein
MLRNLRDRLADWTIDRIARLDDDNELPAWAEELADFIDRDAAHQRLADGAGDE